MIENKLESARLKINKFKRVVFSKFRKKHIINGNFTIISNNCWGGMIYESYDLQKQSPTVGSFFEASDYIKFISNLKYYIEQKIKFIDYKKSKRYKKGHNDSCIVGKLSDIEIYFLHYHSQEEILDKWNRRIKRINYNKILYKFNDQNDCSLKDVKDFIKLPLKNKLFFTVNDYGIEDDCIIKLKKISKENCVMASQEPFGNSKYININDIINKL